MGFIKSIYTIGFLIVIDGILLSYQIPSMTSISRLHKLCSGGMLDSVLLIKGEILFEEEAKSFSGATVYVRLEDVSLADAPSKIVTEQVIYDVSYQAGSNTKLEIRLYGQIPDKRKSYAVSVHVDLNGNGQVDRGDYISMESYPVLTFGYPNQVSVGVREVK